MTNDICENKHGGNEFSVAANESIQERKARQQVLIFTCIATAGNGLTCEEVERQLGFRRSSCSARFAELKKDGRIVLIGKRRTTSGRWAGVWALPRNALK